MSDPRTVLLLHPGAMGASVGGAAVAAGHRVLWVPAGRSEATVRRADAAGLEAAADLADGLGTAGVVLSVCPPHAALDTARSVAAAGFQGLYVDANAVAPQTTLAVAEIVEGAGGRFVDGGIIGPPATRAGITRLYLSGTGAVEAATLFAGSLLEARVLEGPREAASALKMCYAAWTKGSTALQAAIRSLAASLQVEPALVAEWALSQQGLEARSRASITGGAHKAWRWVAEMEEIATTFREAGLPGGFHDGAAEVYRRMRDFKDGPEPPLDAVIAALTAGGENTPSD